MESQNIYIKVACHNANIDKKIYCNWKRAMSKLSSHWHKTPWLCIQVWPCNCMKLKKKLKYVFKKSEIGTLLALMNMHVKAGELSLDFAAKSWIARYHAILCFIHCHSIVFQLSTYVMQKSREEVMGLLILWIYFGHSCRGWILKWGMWSTWIRLQFIIQCIWTKH